ncbi:MULTISPECIES: hypothetical protein [unclassified Pseudofrankia]|uniref:hypothetical protein n=1 Tax=unclassified Pseudofrankia TaxID=2994372 RepID=UPI0008D910B2|nr:MULTISPECIES: hypothetical protein [unclassified Pseudofrankia]MDT3440630.1 hypothetical protein [Pseudofrankia sp. BMG5.37]OHV60563.1 hypothetical protein BCD48_05355 [Pseudofrankia sp. BMG5.36]
MADISVNYEAAQLVAGSLNGAVENIVPQLVALQGAVNALLTSDGGLWMQKSSPVLAQNYQTFNTSATNAVTSINSFAAQFNGIVASLQTMDTQLSGAK